MFEFFRGILYSQGNNFAVIDVNGVGYKLGISLNTFAKLPELGEELFLFAYYHITENSQTLYGFISDDEREIFTTLIGVNKIGPKVGLSIISTLTVQQIVQAVQDQDVTPFKAVSGVGPKTAQRLLLELKGKLHITVDSSTPTSTVNKPTTQSVKDEAYTALVALGYSEAQIRVALTKVEENIDPDSGVEDWITTSLRII